MSGLVKFFISFVGSKAQWVRNDIFRNEIGIKENRIVELFCGSSVISANLAKSCLLIDVDPVICKILTYFNQQIVPEKFTVDDYFEKREADNWWQYAYCLQKMSFSGVFRYNSKKNKYNVPIKKNKDGTYYKTEINVREEYLMALKRWEELMPEVRNCSYLDVPLSDLEDSVVIFDPPYEGSKASYNKDLNYDSYWEKVNKVLDVSKKVIVFDRVENIQKRLGNVEFYTRKMRVNGKYAGDEEGCVFLGKTKKVYNFKEQLRVGDKGELDFYREFEDLVDWLDGVHGDLLLCKTYKVELKTDDRAGKTGNFFIEKYSNKKSKSLGGPYKAIIDECQLFVQYNMLEKEFYFFDPETLSGFTEENYTKLAVHKELGVDVINEKHVTWGHAIPIKYLEPLCLGKWKIGNGNITQKKKFIQNTLINLAFQKGVIDKNPSN